MPGTSSDSVWPITLLGVVALVGAMVTASITSSIPHDMIGLAIACAGFIMGRRVGVLTTETKYLRQGNGNGPSSPQNGTH